MTTHTPVDRTELGYTRKVCAECGTSWPCPPAVAERCERLYLAEGLPCNCGHHDTEKAA